jgi:hypothetical protein
MNKAEPSTIGRSSSGIALVSNIPQNRTTVLVATLGHGSVMKMKKLPLCQHPAHACESCGKRRPA